MYPPQNPLIQKQWTLFVLALERFMKSVHAMGPERSIEDVRTMGPGRLMELSRSMMPRTPKINPAHLETHRSGWDILSFAFGWDSHHNSGCITWFRLYMLTLEVSRLSHAF